MEEEPKEQHDLLLNRLIRAPKSAFRNPKRMLAGQITGTRHIAMIELPVPETAENQVLIKLEVGAICGSDLPYFLCDSEHPALSGRTLPLPPMLSLHELVGTIVESRARRFQEGDRVLALPLAKHGGLGEYFLADADNAVPIPAGGDAAQLVISQPLGTVVHACLKLPNLLGQTAVVIGQGPVGQLFTALLRRMGVTRLIAVDLLAERLEVSRKMGATDTVCGSPADAAEMVQTTNRGRAADLVVEAVGQAETLNGAFQLVRRGGTVLSFGVPHRHNYTVAFSDFFHSEGRLINSVGPDVQHDFPIAVEMIASRTIDVEPLLTHRFPFSRAQDAFALFASQAEGAIKVVLFAER